MFLDMQNQTTVDGVIVYPDVVLADLPRQQSDIREKVIIQGTGSDTSRAAQGTSDQRE